MEPKPVPGNSQLDLASLFAQKGELVTSIEIAQNRLMQVNQQIQNLINNPGNAPQTK